MTAAGPPVLIVTGGSRRVGAAMARLGAKAGYAVVVNYSAEAVGVAAMWRRSARRRDCTRLRERYSLVPVVARASPPWPPPESVCAS